MFVTPLQFHLVLERFYAQLQYDFMLLFVSSFDDSDRTIIREIVNNAKRIDRITGNRICFFYFIKDSYDNMNEMVVRWIKNLSDYTPLYGEGVDITMETADDICLHLGILRSDLPAFILVSKNKKFNPRILTVRDYQDFESYLTPLNILNSYLEDRDSILQQYEVEKKRKIILQNEIDRRNKQRQSWFVALNQLERKKAKEVSLGLIEQVNKREHEIEKIKRNLVDFPIIVNEDIDRNIPYPNEKLLYIHKRAIERLNITLNSHEGEQIITYLQDSYSYSEAVIKVWEIISTRSVRLSRILERIRLEIQERRFNVFISCKSQDYNLAHDLYNFLVSNGIKPFLADTSIKEVGIDQYTALIGEVINICHHMIVFATDINYLETPYVAAEWHNFINDINIGHKPNGKIVTILSPNINPHHLPSWLRDKQSFTTDNYKYSLINFLS